MKNLLALTATALLSISVAKASLPIITSLAAGGNPTTPATVYFPSDPNSQIRVTYLNFGSDTNKGTFTFSTAITAYWEQATNPATTTVTNYINSTNGLSPNATLMLEHTGAGYSATVSSYGMIATGTNTFGQVTNQAFVVIGAGGFGVLPNIGDNVYLMSASPLVIPAGAATNALGGDALFVGNFGRPVQVTLSPTLVSNNIYSAAARYDHP